MIPARGFASLLAFGFFSSFSIAEKNTRDGFLVHIRTELIISIDLLFVLLASREPGGHWRCLVNGRR
jgi:hypothetical protein